MPPDEHVHIISAGETIHTAYPAIFRMLPSITYRYVLADSDASAISTIKENEKQHLAVRHAIDAVKEISASLSRGLPASGPLTEHGGANTVELCKCRKTVFEAAAGAPPLGRRQASLSGYGGISPINYEPGYFSH